MKIQIVFLLAVASAVAGLPEPVRIDSGPLEGVPSAVPGVTAFEGLGLDCAWAWRALGAFHVRRSLGVPASLGTLLV